uniref:JAB1/MPN/MOV34 metalloenzyme domain-containing protein n=1 Tax=Kalanchoe fedtschenkoi TaxID=63787 RepID=A0A7N0THL7_KALFE
MSSPAHFSTFHLLDKLQSIEKKNNSIKLNFTFCGSYSHNAVPFEEDDKDPSIWFLDHNFHEAMFSMFKRINAKEHVVGWYSTGPKLLENDLNVHALFNDYVTNPVLVIIDVQPKELGIPTRAYYAVEEVKEPTGKKHKIRGGLERRARE